LGVLSGKQCIELSTSIPLTNFGMRLGCLAVPVKQWLDHYSWPVLQYRQQVLLWQILVKLADLQ
jgi:hypothetical protein